MEVEGRREGGIGTDRGVGWKGRRDVKVDLDRQRGKMEGGGETGRGDG